MQERRDQVEITLQQPTAVLVPVFYTFPTPTTPPPNPPSPRRPPSFALPVTNAPAIYLVTARHQPTFHCFVGGGVSSAIGIFFLSRAAAVNSASDTTDPGPGQQTQVGCPQAHYLELAVAVRARAV